MDNTMITVTELPKEGYRPLVDYGAWRVAVLRYCEDTRLENIKTMQRHDLTDEVFVLLDGNCTLLCAGRGEEPGEVEPLTMEPMKVYNVKRGTWHNHILDEKGTVLIVENSDTEDANSPIRMCKNMIYLA